MKHEAHLNEVLRGAGIAFVLRSSGSGIAFILTVAIGRILGAEQTGIYFMALSVASISAVISKLGLDNTLLRFVAEGVAKNKWDRVKGVFNVSMRMAVLSSFFCVFFVFTFADLISVSIFKEPSLTNPLRVISIGILPYALMMLIAESLKGLKLIKKAMLVSGILYPLVAMAVIWPLGVNLGTTGVSLAFVLGTTTSTLFGFWAWNKATRRNLEVNPSFEFTQIWRNARPLWYSNLITGVILPWMPLFLLGVWRNSEEVGVFATASRVSMLITLLLVAVNTAVAPKIAELYSNNNLKQIGKIARVTSFTVPIIASPIILFLIVKPELIMALFGNDFVLGSQSLRVLAIGQAIVCATGIGGQILMMTGHVRHMRNGSTVSLIFMLVSAIAFIPIMGSVGAAISTALSMASINVYLVIIAYYKLSRRKL